MEGGNDAPSKPAGAPPPTFVPVPAPAVAEGQPVQGQQQQASQAPPPPGSYPPGAAPMPAPQIVQVPTAQGMPGYVMRPPRVPPQPGMVIVGYETTDAETGCCKCQDLNTVGWMSVILLVLLFWPLCWIPCLIASCHDPTSRPIYGWPNQQQQQQQQLYAPQQVPVVAPPQK